MTESQKRDVMPHEVARQRVNPPLRGWAWFVAAAVPWIIMICTIFWYEGRGRRHLYYVDPDGLGVVLPFLIVFVMAFFDGPRVRLLGHVSAVASVAGRWRVVGPKWPGLPAQLGVIGVVLTLGPRLLSTFSSHHNSLSYLAALGIVLFTNRWRLTAPATLERTSTAYRGNQLRLRAGTVERPVALLRADTARGELRLVNGDRTEVWVVLDPSDDLFALAEEVTPPQPPAGTIDGPKR
jgi:hypothetical protein